VAAFSRARFGRLFLVQFLVALLASGAVIWFLATAWFPILRAAIHQLPATGLIEDQQLRSPRSSTDPLADSRFLTLAIDLDGTGVPANVTDLRVEFRRTQVVLCSLLGCRGWNYPKGRIVPFNQPDLESWWGAWEAVIYSLSSLVLVAGLLASWLVLATLYCPIARLYAFFKDRQLTLPGSWKLSAAAQLPGALLAAVALVLYGQGVIDLIQFIVLWALHVAISWLYLFVSPLHLPRVSEVVPALGANPFGPEKRGRANPFASPDQEKALGSEMMGNDAGTTASDGSTEPSRRQLH